MIKKISLENIKVKSFVTKLEGDNELKGGWHRVSVDLPCPVRTVNPADCPVSLFGGPGCPIIF